MNAESCILGEIRKERGSDAFFIFLEGKGDEFLKIPTKVTYLDFN